MAVYRTIYDPFYLNAARIIVDRTLERRTPGSGWARQLENMLLAVPREIAVNLPERVRELIGYSIHPPFMGYVDGVHPAKSLVP